MQKPGDGTASTAGIALGAVLLSLFAYPGSGHFLLKKKARGMVWAVVFSIALAVTLGLVFAQGSAFYSAATNMGSLEGFTVKSWMPIIEMCAVTSLLWLGAGLDALWLALSARRGNSADANPAAEVGLDQELSVPNP